MNVLIVTGGALPSTIFPRFCSEGVSAFKPTTNGQKLKAIQSSSPLLRLIAVYETFNGESYQILNFRERAAAQITSDI